MNENADGNIVDSCVFLIADEKTAEDTLLLVQSSEQGENEDRLALKCVGVAAEHVNTESVAVSVAIKDVEELLSSVYRDEIIEVGGKTVISYRKREGKRQRNSYELYPEHEL